MLAVGPEEILPRLEQQVLSAVARALLEHQRAPGCGKLPWPAPDGATTVLAPGRPAACPARLRLPTWIAANDWHRLLVYARAEGGLGCRHDGTCLGLRRGPSQVVQAPAVLLLGGRALNALGQRRPGRGSADYFEGDNADLRPPFEQREAGPTFNDRLLALPPGPG